MAANLATPAVDASVAVELIASMINCVVSSADLGDPPGHAEIQQKPGLSGILGVDSSLRIHGHVGSPIHLRGDGGSGNGGARAIRQSQMSELAGSASRGGTSGGAGRALPTPLAECCLGGSRWWNPRARAPATRPGKIGPDGSWMRSGPRAEPGAAASRRRGCKAPGKTPGHLRDFPRARQRVPRKLCPQAPPARSAPREEQASVASVSARARSHLPPSSLPRPHVSLVSAISSARCDRARNVARSGT